MSASARSLLVTDEYRKRLRLVRRQATLAATAAWVLDPADLDGSHALWVARTTPLLTELQRSGARLSIGYLTAFMQSETGRRIPPPTVDDSHSGRARDGRPLAEALVPSLYTIKAAIGDGRPAEQAIKLGLDRALSVIGEESVAPARASLAGGIEQEPRIIGWRRVTGGGCGACLAAATGAIQADDETLEVHPSCSCSKEPVLGDVPDTVRRDTGHDMFRALSAPEQDALLGHEKATLIRDGHVPFDRLIQRERFAVLPSGLTERPLQDLQ
jgi:hypothetical protein